MVRQIPLSVLGVPRSSGHSAGKTALRSIGVTNHYSEVQHHPPTAAAARKTLSGRSGPSRVRAVHQLDFFTPGIIPSSANFRKQMRHIPNFRYTARGRPQSRQRRTNRVLNFGGRCALMIFDLLAIVLTSWSETARDDGPCFFTRHRRRRNPPRRSSRRHSAGITLLGITARPLAPAEAHASSPLSSEHPNVSASRALRRRCRSWSPA